MLLSKVDNQNDLERERRERKRERRLQKTKYKKMMMRDEEKRAVGCCLIHTCWSDRLKLRQEHGISGHLLDWTDEEIQECEGADLLAEGRTLHEGDERLLGLELGNELGGLRVVGHVLGVSVEGVLELG